MPLETLPATAPDLSPPARRGLAATRSDADLVARVRAGDAGAYETIFRRYQQPLLSYCRHMLGGRDEAEDALQQAFIRAHRALLTGPPPRELRPWLYAIARNCCRTALAARRPSAALDGEEAGLDGLAEEVARREDLRALVADLARLPEDQRSALLLAELEDLSHAEIAEIVGCPVSKVKALVYQARSALLAQRNARDASCRDIRQELAVASGGMLRRGPLRRHLRLCAGCRDFQRAVALQRSSLAVVLPVAASAGLGLKILSQVAVAHTASALTAGALTTPIAATGLGGAGTGAAATAAPLAGAGAAVSTGGAATTAAATTAAAVSTGAAATAAAATTAGATATASAVAALTTGAGATTASIAGGGVLAKLAIGAVAASLATAGVLTVHHPRRAPAPAHAAARLLARAGHDSAHQRRHHPGALAGVAPGTGGAHLARHPKRHRPAGQLAATPPARRHGGAGKIVVHLKRPRTHVPAHPRQIHVRRPDRRAGGGAPAASPAPGLKVRRAGGPLSRSRVPRAQPVRVRPARRAGGAPAASRVPRARTVRVRPRPARRLGGAGARAPARRVLAA